MSEARRFAAIAEHWLERDNPDPGTVAAGQAYATLAVARALIELREAMGSEWEVVDAPDGYKSIQFKAAPAEAAE